MSEKIGFKLYQIIGIKSSDLTYPCCVNCYKKVFYVSGRKKWSCNSCNEEFLKVRHRFKLNFEISNFVDYKKCTGFGKPVEIFFGVDANIFYKYKMNIAESDEKWTDLIENAFRYCLLGRWFLFDFKLEKNKQTLNACIIKNVNVPKNELENFISIYGYFKNRQMLLNEINFNDSFFIDDNKSSVINETLIEEDCGEERLIYQIFENLTFLK